MATYLSWNGTCLSADQPLIMADNRSFLAGEGAFETMLARQGRLQALPWHLERLHGTLDWLGWRERLTADAVQQAVTDLLAHQGLDTARIRLTVSRNASGPLDWLLQASPYREPDSDQRQGVAVITVADVPHPRLPHKLTSRIAYVQADRLAREAGAYEALFCDNEIWLEGSRTNVLAVRGEQLVVGDARVILPGIARRAIKAGAAQVGLRVSHTGIERWATRGYDGLYLTNSLIGLLPVRLVDGDAVPVQPELTARLQEAYRLGLAMAGSGA
jgi:branched-subunit amino acid aminotransferase/4-amino-4-deoxychorismate lyase